MERTLASTPIFRFGLFEADAARGVLMRNGVRVKIQDQPFRVLLFLLERPADIVTREELRQRLWPEGTYVDFDGSLNVILKKLRAAINDDSDNPRFIETIPRRGYRFIAPVSIERRGVATEPEIPAPAPDPVVGEVVRVKVVSTRRESGEPASRARLYLTYGASAAVFLLLIAAVWFVWHGKSSHSPAATVGTNSPVRIRKSVAVLGFHSLSARPEDAWLATALSEMLSTELAGGQQLRLVAGEDVANLRIASPWSQTDTLDQATTARIGTALSSDVLVLGSYTNLAKSDRRQLRVDIRMQDARTGEILTELAESGSQQDLFGLVSRLGTKLRDRIGVPHVEDREEAGIIASLPLNPDAARFYALGLLKLRQFDALAAKDLLLQATITDPKFSLGHAMLARAWAQLGYEQKHREEAKRALDLATDLPRSEHMLVEGEYYQSLGNQEHAASVYHALFELFPDNVDYGLQYSNAAMLSGNASQALQLLRQLRTLPPPASEDPRIDLAESRAIKLNKPAALVLIRSAVRKASAQGKIPVYALARREECMTLLYGDDPQHALPVCEDAYNLFLSEGNRAGAADAVRLIADRRGTEGHYEEAIATYQRALTMLNGLGEHAKTGAILNNMAIGYANEGKLDRAAQLYQEAKSHFEQCGDKNNTSTAVSNIADILYLQGNLPGAEKMYQQALDLIAATDRGDPGYVLTRIADLEITQGKLKEAKVNAQKAIDSMLPVEGSYQYLSGAMIELGEVLEAEYDFGGARAQFEKSLALRQKMGATDLAAESQVELATLAMHEGHPQQAETPLRTAIAEFEKENGAPDAAIAYTHLSQALLSQGKIVDARNAAEQAMKFSQSSPDPAVRIPASIQKVRLGLAGGMETNSAANDLRAIILSARKLGYYNLECEARLALGEAMLKSDLSSARTQLAALASDARTRGFELIARRAELASANTGNVAALQKPSR
jgi:DNA-binding winged helix-turn-helix (wHTH) protein/tetratricopeptide (TPR) repeat protein